MSLLHNDGDFLDSSLPQLPKSAATIALVYNMKKEAHRTTGVDLAANPTSNATISLPEGIRTERVSSHDAPLLRTNDTYAEWDTEETVQAVRDAIAERFDVLMVEADESAFGKLVKDRPFFAFNMAEGLLGPSREAHMPAMLEMLGIPYLASDPLTLAICLDKSRTKEILSYHRIPTAPFAVIRTMAEFEDAVVRFPSIVKPLHEGSSKGIYNSCVVRNTGELEREVRAVLDTYHQPALVEEFLPGREFTIGILGNGDDLQVLPIVEIRFDALPPGVNPIYSYEAKWIWDTTDRPLEIYECPARLTPDLRDAIESVCRRAYSVLRCRDWSRIDVRLDAEGRPNVLEVNPLPGILPRPEDNSCLPKAARSAGMTYNQLINTVLDIGMNRYGLRMPEHRLQPAMAQ